MKYIKRDNMNDLYRDAIELVSAEYDYVLSPRGMMIKEVNNAVLELTNPLNCLVTIPARKLNYVFAMLEKFQYVTGDSEPERLIHYNKNFSNFRNKYDFYDGNYAERLYYWLEYIYRLLKNDPDTRQAVMSVYGFQDRHESKDIPCTVSLHFMIRDGKLNLTTYMRSNDLLWGTPYDINGFCFIQEFLARALSVELGTYTHIVGSLHLYTEREFKLIDVMNDNRYLSIVNPRLEIGLNFFSFRNQIKHFLILEEKLRRTNAIEEKLLITSMPQSLQLYWSLLEDYANKT